MNKVKISIVIPLYNEASAIEPLATALRELFEAGTHFEVIFVNDGSTDETVITIKAQTISFPYTIISLSRNFGHQSALLAGLEKATGDIVITMDGDLQHPPSLIPAMIAEHEKGIDIVLTQRVDEQDIGLLKKGTSKLFYRLLNGMSSQKLIESSSDFRSMNRRALTALLAMPEKRKFLRGMVQWIGFSQIVLPFKTQHRISGASKYTWSKMMSLAGNGITSFSTTPLYLSAFVGALLFLLALIYALYVIYVRLVSGNAVEGWASVLFVLLVVGGCLALFLGLIGVYLAAIYDEVKARPTHIIADIYTDKSSV